MAKCPKCGGTLTKENNILVCHACKSEFSVGNVSDTSNQNDDGNHLTDCNSTQIQESAKNSSVAHSDGQQGRLDLLKSRISELEKKQEKNDKVKTGSLSVKEKLAPVAVFFKKWGLKAVLPAALFLIALITLLVCFCGLRGIYVNVNNPNEFYSFSPTSYEYHGNLLGEEYVDEGTWTTSGGELKLTYRDEMFGKITDSYSFSHTGYDTVYITDSLGAKKQFKRVSILAYSTPQNIKVAVSLNGGTGSGASENKLSIGSKIKEPSEPTREGFQFMGWYTTADGWKTEGASQFNFNSRIWEDTTIYANWRSSTEYKLTGDMLPEEGVTFLEGDDLDVIFSNAVSDKYGESEYVVKFKKANDTDSYVTGKAPACNLIAEIVSISFADTVLTLDALLFENSDTLQQVELPKELVNIADKLFVGCSVLKQVSISDGLVSIGNYAFSGCSSLSSITLPKTLISIGTNAFYWCVNLKTVNFEGTVEQWNMVTKGSNWYSGSSLSEVVCSNGTVKIS